MNDLLTTNEILQMIEHSRKPLEQKTITHKEILSKTGKTFYWIIVVFSILHLIYLSMPLVFSTESLIEIFGSEPVAVAKLGQTPPELSLTVINVTNIDFEDLEIGDFVIVYAETQDVFIQKEVVIIDDENLTFEASYAGLTLETYSSDDFIGKSLGDANILQLFNYAVGTVSGYIGTFVTYIVILTVAHYIIFHKPKNTLEEGSDTNG